MVHIYRLNTLILELLSRFAGFAAFYERDKGILNSDSDEKMFLVNLSEKGDFRNYLAHFNYISAGELPKYSILDMMKETRNMLGYDRKLKNAVTKAVIKVLDKNGIDVTFSLDEGTHRFTIKGIQSKNMVHLKGEKKENKNKNKSVLIPIHSEEYIKIVREMLEIKKN